MSICFVSKNKKLFKVMESKLAGYGPVMFFSEVWDLLEKIESGLEIRLLIVDFVSIAPEGPKLVNFVHRSFPHLPILMLRDENYIQSNLDFVREKQLAELEYPLDCSKLKIFVSNLLKKEG